MGIIKWEVDPAHSDVQFKIRHLVISTITGSFNNFSGGVSADNEGFENAEIHFALDVDSIDTNMAMRDAHLKSADFFDATHFPHITFQSVDFRKLKGDKFALTGNLTMKGITKPIELEAEYGGSEKDAQGNTKIGFEVTGRISRWEFGLNYRDLTESGGLVLGEDVKLIANIQLVKKAA
jgi:polyisoprenoid-binding protein YceI